MKIFVTGGTGFIGQHLIKALVKGRERVLALVRRPEQAKELEKIGVEIILGDLNSISSLKKLLFGIDVVYHLAALRGEWHKWEEFYKNNVLATENLLKASLGQVRHFIFMSSVAVLGYPKNLPADESFPIKPQTFYAKSKAEGERLVLEFFKKGLPATIIRPTVVYGPGDIRGLFLKLARLVKKRRFPLFRKGNSFLHFIYIDDLISGLLKVRKKKPEGEIYILASKKPIKVRDLVNLLAKNLDVKPPSLNVPIWLAKIAGLLGEKLPFWREPPISQHKVDIFTKDQIYSSLKAAKELDFGSKVDYREGLEKTIKWYQENGYL